MNWYVASRVRHKEYLREVSEKLKGLGETVTSDWLYQDSLKPYEENDVAVKALSESVVQAVLASDVFVLISDPEGTDMFVELGIYRMLNWEHYYSFPIYIAMAALIRWFLEWLLKKCLSNPENRLEL